MKNLAKFTRKPLCWGLFLKKMARWRPSTSLNRDSVKVFCLRIFLKFFKNLNSLLQSLSLKLEALNINRTDNCFTNCEVNVRYISLWFPEHLNRVNFQNSPELLLLDIFQETKTSSKLETNKTLELLQLMLLRWLYK